MLAVKMRSAVAVMGSRRRICVSRSSHHRLAKVDFLNKNGGSDVLCELLTRRRDKQLPKIRLFLSFEEFRTPAGKKREM